MSEGRLKTYKNKGKDLAVSVRGCEFVTGRSELRWFVCNSGNAAAEVRGHGGAAEGEGKGCKRKSVLVSCGCE